MVEKKVSAAQRKATEKYLGKFEELRARVPKGQKEEIQAHAAAQGESVNAFINRAILEAMERAEEGGGEEQEDGEEDELLAQAVELAVDSGQISASMLQRRFRVGYARAGRLLDEMEKRKLISGFEGSKPRQVLISREEFKRIFGKD